MIDLASVNVHIWCGTAFIGSSLLVEDSMGWVLGGCFVEEIEPSDKKFDLMNLNITFNLWVQWFIICIVCLCLAHKKTRACYSKCGLWISNISITREYVRTQILALILDLQNQNLWGVMWNSGVVELRYLFPISSPRDSDGQ